MLSIYSCLLCGFDAVKCCSSSDVRSPKAKTQSIRQRPRSVTQAIVELVERQLVETRDIPNDLLNVNVLLLSWNWKTFNEGTEMTKHLPPVPVVAVIRVPRKYPGCAFRDSRSLPYYT